MGFFNILESFKSGKIKKHHLIKPNNISVSDIYNIFSLKGHLCITTSNKYVSNPKYWRGLKRDYLEDLIKLSSISDYEFKRNIYMLLTSKKYYLSKTVNYYNNFEYSIPHKSKLEEYCNISVRNKHTCNFTISLDYIIKLIS